MSAVRTPRRRTLLATGAVLAFAGLLAGCGSAGGDAFESNYSGGEPMTSMAEEAMPDMMVDGETVAAPRLDGSSGSPTSTDLQRQIIRTAYVSMRVDDVAQSAIDVRNVAGGFDGVVTDESLTADGPDSQTGANSFATITVQVPADRLEAFLSAVTDLGTVDSRTVSAQDVTLQVVDLDARIDALTTSIDRLRELLTRADTVEDLLAIETELSRRQADLDALQAQRTWLGQQVAMSTVTVSLSPMTYVTSGGAPGFLSGLESGWSALVAAAGAFITIAGFLLPFLVVLGLVAIPVTVLLVRLSRRGRRVKEWESGAAEGSAAEVSAAQGSAADEATADDSSSQVPLP